MKSILIFFIVINSFLLLDLQNASAQDVLINVPIENLINSNDFETVATVFNTQGSTNWRAGVINPTIKANGSDWFRSKAADNPSLPSEVLQWQLDNIGGQPAPFRNSDKLPDFKWFSTREQTWYHPSSIYGQHPAGNIAFKFRIPKTLMLTNSFIAGDYSMAITHNYGRSGWYAIEFSPDNFNVILNIPAAISWISNNPSQYITVSSLDEYRNTPTNVEFNFGLAQVFSTVNFDLFAKAASADIQFTSSKGTNSSRNLSLIQLSSLNTKIPSSSLTSSWKQLNTNSKFAVEKGNRHNFELKGRISAADFKNYFFEAGTYYFQLNLDAKNTENNLSSIQNTDVVLKVPPLSEIIVPTNLNVVNFEFNSAEQYQQGETKLIQNQIRLSNNENYELYVKSSHAFFNQVGVETNVPASTLQVSVKGTGIKQALSTSSQKLIQSGTPILDRNLDMEYTISPTSAQALVAKPQGTYSINVIYSFTAI